MENTKEKAARARFDEIVGAAVEDHHGTKTFRDLHELFNVDFKMKPGNAKAFLESTSLVRTPVRSADITPQALVAAGLARDHDHGCFPFLQGDIIKSLNVAPIAGVALPETPFWQVISRDCESVRAPWVKVCPVVFVDKGDDNWQKYLVGLVFRSPYLSSLPPIPALDHKRGLLTDLKHPFFLERVDCSLATQLATLTETGWHLFSATLSATTNQVINMNESLGLRRLVIE